MVLELSYLLSWKADSHQMAPIFALSQNYPDEIALARQSCLWMMMLLLFRRGRSNISDIVDWRYLVAMVTTIDMGYEYLYSNSFYDNNLKRLFWEVKMRFRENLLTEFDNLVPPPSIKKTLRSHFDGSITIILISFNNNLEETLLKS